MFRLRLMNPYNSPLQGHRSNMAASAEDPERLPCASEIESHEQIATRTALNVIELVDWDGVDDPANPRNWSALWKWGNIGVISIITIITYGGCPLFHEVRTSTRLLTFGFENQPPRVVYVYTSRTRHDEGFPQRQLRDGLPCGLGLCHWVCYRPAGSRAFVGNLRPIDNIPRIQRLISSPYDRVRPEHTGRRVCCLSLACGLRGSHSDGPRWRVNCRYHPSRASRSSHDALGSWAAIWSRECSPNRTMLYFC